MLCSVLWVSHFLLNVEQGSQMYTVRLCMPTWRRRRERSRSPPPVARRTEFITSFSSEPSAGAAASGLGAAASYMEPPRGAAPSHTQAQGPTAHAPKRSVPPSPVPVMMTSSCRPPSYCCLTSPAPASCLPALCRLAAPAA